MILNNSQQATSLDKSLRMMNAGLPTLGSERSNQRLIKAHMILSISLSIFVWILWTLCDFTWSIRCVRDSSSVESFLSTTSLFNATKMIKAMRLQPSMTSCGHRTQSGVLSARRSRRKTRSCGAPEGRLCWLRSGASGMYFLPPGLTATLNFNLNLNLSLQVRVKLKFNPYSYYYPYWNKCLLAYFIVNFMIYVHWSYETLGMRTV